jgi:hypothetical protein
LLKKIDESPKALLDNCSHEPSCWPGVSLRRFLPVETGRSRAPGSSVGDPPSGWILPWDGLGMRVFREPRSGGIATRLADSFLKGRRLERNKKSHLLVREAAFVTCRWTLAFEFPEGSGGWLDGRAGLLSVFGAFVVLRFG